MGEIIMSDIADIPEDDLGEYNLYEWICESCSFRNSRQRRRLVNGVPQVYCFYRQKYVPNYTGLINLCHSDIVYPPIFDEPNPVEELGYPEAFLSR